MKFDHPGAACLAVQAIDILRDDQIDPAGLLQPRQRVVAATGSRPGHRGPTEEAARPVTPAGAFQVQEVMLPHRLRALPVALPNSAVSGLISEPQMSMVAPIILQGRTERGGQRQAWTDSASRRPQLRQSIMAR